MNFTFLPVKNSQRLCFIDSKDFNLCSKFNWRDSKGYPVTGNCLALHKLLCDFNVTDHVNRNTYDNRRLNLRASDYSLNQANRLKFKVRASSQYKGVHFHKSSKKYYATIKVKYKPIHLGGFLTEVEAALAYNKAAYQYFGGHAVLNKI